MASFKQETNKKWSVQFYYKDFTGKIQRKHKYGFNTKKDAKLWAEEFIRREEGNINMNFESLYEEYISSISQDIRESSLKVKEHIVEMYILPYFRGIKLSKIDSRFIMKWQVEVKKRRFSDSYLSTINSQLSAIFNYAGRVYNLTNNPCKTAGTMGRKRKGNLGIWSQEDMDAFLEAVSDKTEIRYAFFLMYWTGIRLGELLALTVSDLDFDKGTLSITKSLYRTGGKDIITPPKTEAGIRTIHLPEFVLAEMEEYCGKLYGRTESDRLFLLTKSHLEKEIKRGAGIAGLKPIRVHDLRHSHVSILISRGINIGVIAKRLGHESIRTTLNTYAHIFDEDARKVAEILDNGYMGGNE